LDLATEPKKIILENGVTILLDRVPHSYSASCIICLRSGSRDESEALSGVTHLAEHLLFKRTLRKSPFDIAVAIDDFGGEVNAFTDPESLCLVGRVSGSRTEELISFFAELLFDGAFNAADLVVEKEIIRQEIVESLDDPGESAYQEFSQRFWGRSALGQPVFGTLASVEALSPETIRTHLAALTCGTNLVIAVAGCFAEESLISKLEQLFGALPAGQRAVRVAPAIGSGAGLIARPVQQSFITLGVQWPHFADPRYLAGAVVSTVLGDGSSSRLFQILREKHGLAYDVQSSIDSYSDVGALVITATVDAPQLNLALSLMLDELERLRDDGVTHDEFRRAVNSLVAQLEMDTDSISSRMWRLIETELNLGSYVQTQEWIARLKSLTLNDCLQVTADFLSQGELALGVAGKVDGLDLVERVEQFGAARRLRH